MRIVQDWMPYKDSLLFRWSDEYFKNSGQEAFSNEGKNKKHVVPNEMTNSIAHARSIANFVKDNLEFYPKDEKFKILEIGSGSGVFAKHFLICARELNILDRIEYLVTDYSLVGLKQIQSNNILKEFIENENYRFIHLDILNPKDATDLDGNPYALENISASILNYILCVLGQTFVRSSTEVGLQELYIRFKEQANTKFDLDYLESLLVEHEWRVYKTESQTDLEKKFIDILDEHNKSNDDQEYIAYCYKSLEVLDILLSISNKNAFIYIAEMPNRVNAASPYKIYANTIAQPINDGLVANYVSSKKIEMIRSIDRHYPLVRIVIFNNQNKAELFIKRFTQEYLEKNDSNLLIELRAMLSQFSSRYSCSIMKVLLDRLFEIDKYSYESHLLRARYFFLNNELSKAKSAYELAEQLDHLGNLDVQGGNLKKLLELSCEKS
jgi:hypothetical protein